MNAQEGQPILALIFSTRKIVVKNFQFYLLYTVRYFYIDALLKRRMQMMAQSWEFTGLWIPSTAVSTYRMLAVVYNRQFWRRSIPFEWGHKWNGISLAIGLMLSEQSSEVQYCTYRWAFLHKEHLQNYKIVNTYCNIIIFLLQSYNIPDYMLLLLNSTHIGYSV